MKIKLPIFSRQSLFDASGWIALILGLIFYIGGYSLQYNAETLKTEFHWDKVGFWAGFIINIGDILLVGGVVGFLTSMAQWKGILIEELTNLIYGKELLSRRADLKNIWENITKQLFKNKFLCIHREILDTISHYLPNDNEISYYDNFTEDITVKWVDKTNGIISTTEIMAFDIIAESKAHVDYDVCSRTKYCSLAGEPKDTVKHTIYLNEQIFETPDTEIKLENDDVIAKTTIPLDGAKKYRFKFLIEKTYCIFNDFYISYRAKRFIHNMHISLLLDDGISAEFIERGQFEPFTEVKKTKRHIIMSHDGVILPKQGFVFALKTD